jgi:hypothetical protein
MDDNVQMQHLSLYVRNDPGGWDGRMSGKCCGLVRWLTSERVTLSICLARAVHAEFPDESARRSPFSLPT